MANASTPLDTSGHNDTLMNIVTRSADGSVTTTSLIVAEKFGKDHANVLKAVENLECSQEFNRVNFNAITYTDSRGRQQRAVEMTRDGFMFLAMGFTGSAAAEWKEKFIVAFNHMEAMLQARQSWAMPPELVQSMVEMSQAVKSLSLDTSAYQASTTDRLDRHETILHGLVKDVSAIVRRKPFSKATIGKWNGVLVTYYNGHCPCCRKVRIVDQYGRAIDGVYEADHWRTRGKNGIQDGWPTCTTCNHGILETERESRAHAFLEFHRLRKELYPQIDYSNNQIAFNLEDAA